MHAPGDLAVGDQYERCGCHWAAANRRLAAIMVALPRVLNK